MRSFPSTRRLDREAAHRWRDSRYPARCGEPPDLVAIARPALDESTVRLSWETRTRAEQPYRYSVQVSTDGGQTWQTVAVGIAEPSVDLDRRQFAPGQTVQPRTGLMRSQGLREIDCATLDRGNDSTVDEQIYAGDECGRRSEKIQRR